MKTILALLLFPILAWGQPQQMLLNRGIGYTFPYPPLVNWAAQENTGTNVNDKSGNGWGPMYFQGTTQPSWSNGPFAGTYCVRFTGISNCCMGYSNTITPFSSLQHATLSWWGYLANTNDTTQFGAGNNGAPTYDFNNVYTAKVFYPSVANGAGSYYQTGTITLTGWHHFVVTYDGTLATNRPVAYIDGTNVTITQGGGAAAPNTTPSSANLGLAWAIARDTGSGTRYWGGGGCGYLVFTNTLTANQVSNLFNAGAAGF